MNAEVANLLSALFSPKVALIGLLILGILGALYTAFLKYFFDRRLKESENQHAEDLARRLKSMENANALELAKVQGQLSAANSVLIQNLQAENSRSLKVLEAALTKGTQEELQRSQAALAEQSDEKQSRRDYEYEARKRLYHECEPLVFELLESSENAGDRIRGIARAARQGNLPEWFLNNEYYIASTMYYLIAPVAVYKLMRRRLTIVDLRLNLTIATHYRLAKQLAWSFTSDFDFAWGLRVCGLNYEPNNARWEALRKEDPRKYWRQGLPYGRLDNAAESLLIHDPEPNSILRIMSFGEFEQALHESGSIVDRAFATVRDIFRGFDPIGRPVLWRMLIAQAHIYRAIVQFHGDEMADQQLLIFPIPPEEHHLWYWNRDLDEADSREVEEPFIVAEAYFRKFTPTLFVGEERI